MSCPDLRRDARGPAAGRSRPAAALGLLLAATVLVVSGCAAGADQPSAGDGAAASSTAVPADDVTQRLAAVEFARQCAVTASTFPDEAALTTDLDDRLAADGLTHAQWKDWHDALVDSPDLVAQLVEVSAPGCSGA